MRAGAKICSSQSTVVLFQGDVMVSLILLREGESFIFTKGESEVMKN